MRVLSSTRARLALLIVIPTLPAALISFGFFRQTLLAQRLVSQPDAGNALLGQELFALGLLGGLTLLAVWIGPSVLVARGTLLSAAAPIAAATRPPTAQVGGRGGDVQPVLASLAHDLRSRLTSIKAASTLVLDHQDDLTQDERRELLDAIREGADGLDRLISNAVQLSKSQEGKLTMKKVPAGLDEVASRAVERLGHRLRNHRVAFESPDDLPEIPLDVVQLDQALANLLENAAGFSPDGSEIAVTIERLGNAVLLRIEDRGPGIPESQREQVFKPFVKLAAGGTAGLGLSISRTIVEAHGGRLLIEDSRSGGAAIVIELPIDPLAVVIPEYSEEPSS